MKLFEGTLAEASVRRRDTVFLILALAIAHAPMLVNNGLFNDDFVIFVPKPGYPADPYFMIKGAGHAIAYGYCELANLTGHPIAFMKLMAVLGIFVGALSLRYFLDRLAVFSRFETLFLTFLTWTYAGFQAWAAKLLAALVFSFALLCVGLALFAKIAGRPERPNVWLRLSSLVALFVSFSVNSMMVAYLIGLCAVAFVQRPADRDWSVYLTRSITRFWDFLALPLIYWFSTNYLFPKAGGYKDYYKMRLPHSAEVFSWLSDFSYWGFSKPLDDLIGLARESSYPVALALIVAFGFVLCVGTGKRFGNDRQNARLMPIALLLALSVVTFALLASPYIAIGANPDAYYYESRHMFLFGIPTGLLAIALLRILLLFPGRLAALVLAALLLTVNLTSLWTSYFQQQARWLRQVALIDSLQRSYSEPPATVFNLVDLFLAYPTHYYLGAGEVTGALYLAWGDRPLFGYTGRNERNTVLQEFAKGRDDVTSAFRHFEVRGPQATIELIPREPVLSNFRLSERYYACLLSRCDARALADAQADARVHVGPIPNLAPAPETNNSKRD